MRSKIAKRILDETPQEVKDKVQDYANKLILYGVIFNEAPMNDKTLTYEPMPLYKEYNTVEDKSEVELSSTYCKFCKQDPCERLEWSHPLEDED